MRDVKISFRVSDSEVAEILEKKKENGEMSAYINEALRFYKDNYQEMKKIRAELEEIKEMLRNGSFAVRPEQEKEEEKIDPVQEILIGGLDAFL